MADPPFDREKGAPVGKRAPGAPRKLTPQARGVLLDLLGKSVFRKDACAAVGISLQTLTNEIKRDPDFKVEVHQAELAGVIGASDCVTKGAAEDPKIALEYLARKRPKQWAKRQKVDLTSTTVPRGGREILDRLIAKLAGGVTEEDASPGQPGPRTGQPDPSTGPSEADARRVLGEALNAIVAAASPAPTSGGSSDAG